MHRAVLEAENAALHQQAVDPVSTRPHTNGSALTRQPTWWRGILLLLILLAFARVTWQLDGKDLWWDESLSLQRAEADWETLLRATLVITDGFSHFATTDQHPFLFFVLLGPLVRLAGISEYVLRFPAAAAATLMVAVIWVVASNLARRQVLPPSTPYWATFLIAINPFLLWYGQEARPYTLWALLTLLQTYFLLHLIQHEKRTNQQWMSYLFVTALLLSSHYYAIFVLPVHALALFIVLFRRYRWWAVVISGLLLVAGAGIALWLASIVWSQGGGGNFSPISLPILLADLLNAFSMGLSVNINDVRWLNWLFGLSLLIGVGAAIRSRAAVQAGGWLLPALIIVPISAVMVMNEIEPGYMNARHLSLLVGFYVLAAAGGLGAIWLRWRMGSVILASVLVAGTLYSTANYFTALQYSKDDYRAMGDYLEANLLPGDLLLLNPPSSWRIFTYYLPIDQINRANATGVQIATQNVPLLHHNWPGTFALLGDISEEYRRIWLAYSGTHPFDDPEGQVRDWLFANSAVHLKEIKFHSSDSFLMLDLFLPDAPVAEGIPPEIMRPLNVTFGDQIRFLGYDLAMPIGPQNALPITLYWQTVKATEDHYKYILRLSKVTADGQEQMVALTEREPYDGAIPTSFWDVGQTIIEYSEVPMTQEAFDPTQRYQLTLQIYHAETLEKLPLTAPIELDSMVDEQTIVLPVPANLLN